MIESFDISISTAVTIMHYIRALFTYESFSKSVEESAGNACIRTDRMVGPCYAQLGPCYVYPYHGC